MHSTVSRIVGGAALGLMLAAVVGIFVLARLGYGFYIVHTGSMEPTYPSGDLVVERAGQPYGVGSVITFEHGAGPDDLVTHRVTRITGAGISTKGDGNRSADAWTIRPAQVHGTVVGALPRMGYVAYYLKQPAGVGSLLTAGLALVLLWGLFFPARESRPSAAANDTAEEESSSAPQPAPFRVPRQRRPADHPSEAPVVAPTEEPAGTAQDR